MLVNNLAALTFLPQEQLNLAHSCEIADLNRYRWLALTFLPFDSSVSHLMSAIGMECVHRLCNLQDVARKLGLGACVNAEPVEVSPPLNIKSSHFFIIDEPMGHQFLMRAEEAAKASYSFFNWLLETNATPELHNTLFNFVTQKNNEYRILQECREQRKFGLSGLS
ncbi:MULTISPECIES: hypothetical protein [unclassified Halomonas]|uniref:hypothetical protein n=1 Tax=unclassified Halomonas TaxID=2609666 RepID=UPI00099038F4|nr:MULTISPECIES: hypothetical protein [unclassified Halomonas]AQU82264.1 hypothetical protein B2G49_06425 [Halomonas sp. 'Soap Lake \